MAQAWAPVVLHRNLTVAAASSRMPQDARRGLLVSKAQNLFRDGRTSV